METLIEEVRGTGIIKTPDRQQAVEGSSSRAISIPKIGRNPTSSVAGGVPKDFWIRRAEVPEEESPLELNLELR